MKENDMREYNFVKLDITNVEDCIRGWIAAFPRWKYSDALKTAKKRVETMCFFGAYENGVYKGLIVGAETSFNYRGIALKGFELDHLHIEPLYRKTGVSKFLIQSFEDYAKKHEYFMINVGPFSTAYYRIMGYGFGSKILSFKSKPENFQYHANATAALEYYDGKTRRKALESFMRKQRVAYHGSFNFNNNALKVRFKKMRDKNRIVIMSVIDDKICGVINYEAADKISIDDFLFNKPLAIQALSSYLHSLKGNIESITVNNAQPSVLAMCDKPYEMCLNEESMVKVIDVKSFIEATRDIQYRAQDISIEMSLYDAITKKNEAITIQCENGYLCVVSQKRDSVKVSMHLSDFSTMLFSQHTFKTYLATGLAKINDESSIQTINDLFAYEDIPYNI